MATEHDVRAQLILDTSQYYRGLAGAQGRTERLGRGLGAVGAMGARAGRRAASGMRGLGLAAQRSLRPIRGMTQQFLLMAGAHLGIHALTGVIGRLGRGILGYSSDIEKAQIGITGIIAAVDDIPFEEAEKRAKKSFAQIRKMSISTPATPLEMLDIFKGIIGPVRAAGASMEKVLDLTNKTTLTATALGVDFEQASRDITMMVRGAAGMEVKMFSLLRSTGAIKETTEEWNKGLPPEERIRKLDEALSKFATPEKAQAFQRSWVGVSSTFKGLAQEFGRAGFAPILREAAKQLGKLNDALIENQDRIKEILQTYGQAVALRIESAANAAVRAFQFLQQNWGQITERFNQGVSALRAALPVIAGVLGAFQLFEAGTALAGVMKLGTAAAGTAAVGRAASGGVAVRSRKPRLSKGGRSLLKQQAADPFRSLDFSAKGGLLFGGLAGLKGLFSGAAGGTAAAGGGSAAAAGATAAAGTAAAALGILAGAIVAVGGAVMAVKEHWQTFKIIFDTATGDLQAQGMDLWSAFKGYLQPMMKLVGNTIMTVVTPALQVFSASLETAVVGLTRGFEILGSITSFIEQTLQPQFNALFKGFRMFGAHLDFMLEKLGISPRDIARGGLDEAARDLARFGEGLLQPLDLSVDLGVPKALGGSVVNQNNDFRGSRFTVKQEFGDEHDPDRVVSVMMRDLTKQAEHRISSRHAPAFTR